MPGKYLPANHKATLVADAYTAGDYYLDGVVPSEYVAVTAGTTVIIGPYDQDKQYVVNNLSFTTAPYIAGDVDALSYAPAFVVSNGTEAANALTTTGTSGVITTSALTTAASDSYAITWTNTSITPSSVVMLSLMGGTNTVKDISFECVPGSGTATLTIYNNVLATTALDGTVKLGYLIV